MIRSFENLQRPKLWLISTCLALVVGCNSDNPSGAGKGAATEQELPWKGVKLRVLVVEDDRLAEAVGRLRAEWRGTTGADLEVAELSQADLLEGKLPDADALIYPAYELGVLVERDLLRPLPDGELSNPEVAWEEIFEAEKTHDASWAATIYAFPFGSPTLVCCYRKDLLEKLDRQPPSTWSEYEELAALLADRDKLGDAAPAADLPWSGTMEPLGPGWAGLTLLARAASYAKHRNHFSTLFDMESMDPLIAGPPFVRALDELLAVKSYMPAEAIEASHEQVHEAFLTGRCGMAITWTSPAFAASGDQPAKEEAKELDIGFIELPGSRQAFNPKTNQWDARREEEASHVAFVGLSGRIGSVTKQSSQPVAAFELLGWLSGPQWSRRVSTATSETTLFRRSHLKASHEWTDPRIGALAALNYAEVVERALGSADFFGAPRLAGRDRYLAALDEAVRAAATGKQTSQAALEDAAGKWRDITAELGLDEQRAAYRRSLGLR